MHTEKVGFKQIDPEILKSYLDGKGSFEEQQKLEKWFSDLLANEELRKATHVRWKQISDEPNLLDLDFERLQYKIQHMLRLEEAAEYRKKRLKTNLVGIITRVAAVLFLPIVLFTLFNWRSTFLERNSIANVEVQCPIGTRTSFILPDGSTGWLNSGSKLCFPTNFKTKERTVKLTGEAYFDVLENQKRPFTVVTDGLRVIVHGTTFNIKEYPDDQTSEIILEEGSVEAAIIDEFGREKSLALMKPGERGIFFKNTGIFQTNVVDVEQYISWREGKLVLQNLPMTEIVKKINRWFNVNIIIRDSRLDNYSYRATFVDEKLDEILKIFELTSPIKHKETGREKYPDGSYGKRTIELYYHD